MKPISRAQEQKIVSAAERVVDLVNQGSTPNDALYKVASDEQLNPDFVRRLAEVYNTSRQLAHFKSASAEHRADAFPLADSAQVVARMYPSFDTPEGVKTVSAQCLGAWYAPPPDFSAPTVKQAAFAADVKPTHGLADVGMLVKRAKLHKAALQRNLEVAQSDVTYQRELASDAIQKAANYFRSVSHTPFATVESNVLRKYGSAAEPLMGTIYNACRGAKFGEKRGSAAQGAQLFDAAREPYTFIDEAVHTAREWQKAADEERAVREELTEFNNQLNESLDKLANVDKPRIPFPFEGVQKQANLPYNVAKWLLPDSGLTEALKKGPKPIDPSPRALDPSHDQNMRRAKAQSLLNELLATDDVVAKHDPADVATAYNELAELAPRVMERPALLRGMLARRLEMGRTEPFEAGQMVDTETALKKMEELPQQPPKKEAPQNA